MSSPVLPTFNACAVQHLHIDRDTTAPTRRALSRALRVGSRGEWVRGRFPTKEAL